jgi:hypothetical protein
VARRLGVGPAVVTGQLASLGDLPDEHERTLVGVDGTHHDDHPTGRTERVRRRIFVWSAMGSVARIVAEHSPQRP